MKILFVSTSIPPATDMQTTRNMYLIKSLLDHNNEVDILTCGDYKAGSSSFDDILNRVRVYRTEFPKVYKWHLTAQKFFRKTPFLKIHNVIIKYYAKPDLYAGWNKVAIKYIKVNRLKDYNCIITSSGSYTAHFVGEEYKKLTKASWIADYGDPWGLDEYGNVKKKYKKKEESLLANCDGLVFTTQNTIDAYKNNYLLDIPFCLVQCGFDGFINDIECNNKDVRKQFTYTGIAYNSSRNLGPFLNVCSSKNNINVNIVGTYSESLKKRMEQFKNINFSGRVPYLKSLEIQGKSDVLVHIGNMGSLQIPGKTYIYLSTQKPILYIRQEKGEDPTFNLLSKFPGVVCCNNFEEDIKCGIESILNQYDVIKRQAESRKKMDEIKQYKWSELGNRFSNFVHSICDDL